MSTLGFLLKSLTLLHLTRQMRSEIKSARTRTPDDKVINICECFQLDALCDFEKSIVTDCDTDSIEDILVTVIVQETLATVIAKLLAFCVHSF